MTFESIIKDIKSGKPDKIYLLHGEEPFFIDQIEQAIEQNVLTEAEKAFNLSIFYGQDSDVVSIMDASRKYPMMSQKQVVIVREAQSLKKIEDLVNYVSRPVDTTVLVICHKHKKLDGRTQLSKQIASKGTVFESKPIYESKIPDWISSNLKNAGLISSPEINTMLAEALGNDLSKISNELEKLKLNLPQGAKLDKDVIDKYIGISKDYNIFEFSKFIGERNTIKVVKSLKYFASNLKKNPPVVIVTNLCSYFNKIYLTHGMRNASDMELMKVLKLGNAFFLGEYKSASRKYNWQQCERVINILKNYDLKFKGLNSGNTKEEELLKEMCIQIINVA